MPESQRRRLDQPRSKGRFSLDIDPEAFGRFSENLARFMGTGKFLFWQTLFVLVWIAINLVAAGNGWDPYPFILLNLAFSTQAAYAAPLILLAQNRQDDRDRVSLDEDRLRAAQTKADTEFLARELAALRVAIGDLTTRDYLRAELEDLQNQLEGIAEAVGSSRQSQKSGKAGKSKTRAKDKARPASAATGKEPVAVSPAEEAAP